MGLQRALREFLAWNSWGTRIVDEVGGQVDSVGVKFSRVYLFRGSDYRYWIEGQRHIIDEVDL
jgi:hypothetical protein